MGKGLKHQRPTGKGEKKKRYSISTSARTFMSLVKSKERGGGESKGKYF